MEFGRRSVWRGRDTEQDRARVYGVKTPYVRYVNASTTLKTKENSKRPEHTDLPIVCRALDLMQQPGNVQDLGHPQQ